MRGKIVGIVLVIITIMCFNLALAASYNGNEFFTITATYDGKTLKNDDVITIDQSTTVKEIIITANIDSKYIDNTFCIGHYWDDEEWDDQYGQKTKTVKIRDFDSGSSHKLFMEAVSEYDIDLPDDTPNRVVGNSNTIRVYVKIAGESEPFLVDDNSKKYAENSTITVEPGDYLGVITRYPKGQPVKQIQYVLGSDTNNIGIIEGSSGYIKVPEFEQGKKLSLQIVSLAYDNKTFSAPKAYYLERAKATTTVDISAKLDGSSISEGSTTSCNGGETIKMTGTSNLSVSKIEYTFNGSSKTENGSSCTISVPAKADTEKTYTLKCKAIASDGTASSEKTYKFKVPAKDKPVETEITVDLKNNGSVVSAGTIIEKNVGDSLTIVGTSNIGVKLVSYRWNNESVKEENGSSYTLKVPNYDAGSTQTLIIVSQATDEKWSNSKTFYIKIAKAEEATNIDVDLISDGTKQSDGATLNKKTGDSLTIQATSNKTVKSVSYKWDNGNYEEKNGSSFTLSVPQGTDGSSKNLTIKAKASDGKESSSKTFTIKYPESQVTPKEEKIEITLTKGNDNARVVANVDNGLFSKFVYNWDDGSNKESSNNPTDISYPTALGNHVLKVYGVTQSGLKSDTKTLNYSPDALKGEITAKGPNGNLSEEKNKPTQTNPDDKITVTTNPENNFSKVEYNWDDGTFKTLPSDKIIKVPSDFKPGTTHKLTIKGTLKDGGTVTKIYYITIPKDDEGDLDVDPWMKENEDAEGLIISLRNRSDTKKDNQNFYMLNEEVIYLVDYKNAGKDIDSEVKVELKLPLEFKIVDADGGSVDTSKKTITWTHSAGLKKEYANTKKVVVKYTALSKKSYSSEMIYPQATIYKAGKKQDISAVINCIYKDEDTEFEEVHKPYMFGDADKPTFRPDDGISRAEGALVLMRIFGVNYKNVTNITTKESDIEDTYMEARKAITKATELGVIEGYPNGTYKPNEKMTRAEFMNIIAKYVEKNAEVDGLEMKKENAVVLYKNPKSGTTWALPAVTLLARLNMTDVSSSNKDLRLEDDITRAEVAQLCNFYLFRAPAKITSKVSVEFSDVTRNHKLYGDIVEATREEHEYTVTEDGKEKV